MAQAKDKPSGGIRKAISKKIEQFKNSQAKASYQVMAEELFQDYYRRRHDVYKMNFFRGIFFGLGSLLGGTIVVALIIWILSLFVNFPFVSDYVKNTQDTIEQGKQR